MYMQEMFSRYKSIRKQTAPLHPSSALRQSTQTFGLSTLSEVLVWAPLVGTEDKSPPLWNKAFIPNVLLFLHLCLLQEQGSKTPTLKERRWAFKVKESCQRWGVNTPPLVAGLEVKSHQGTGFQTPLCPCRGSSQGPPWGTHLAPGDPIVGSCLSTGPYVRNWGGTDCVKETSYSSHFIKVIFVHWKIIIM